ncbi:MAG: P-type conjugative transfer ATPase TrbB [Bryobacterales bacterium]|nr:P-type conjugative transfer ATPase TrbB [Bryobacterales bacterium]
MFTIDGIHRAVNTGYHEMLNAATEPNDRKSRLDEKLKRELGECVLAALADDRTEDVVLNPDSRLWLSRQGEGWVRIGELSPTQAQAAMGTVAAQKGTVINYDRPILETELPIDGSRFEAIVPPVASRPIFAIRQRPRRIFTLEDYERAEILTDRNDLRNRARIRSNFAESVAGLSHSDALRLAVRERKNILIVGSTGSGKTTLVNACLDLMAKVCPTDRVVSIEDTMELQCPVANSVDLRAVGRVSMLDCLRACMRLKPRRIVVGEARGAEAHVMLKAWNTGHPGGVATVHANDAVSGLVRLESLVAEATSAPQQSLIAEAVDLVVFIDEDSELAAGRKVRELLVVTGYDAGRYSVEYV